MPAGQPTRAATAFAESCGVPVDSLQRLDEGKGHFLFYHRHEGRARRPSICCRASCRHRSTRCRFRSACAGAPATAEFVRPVHWLVMLYGKDVVPASRAGRARGQSHAGPSLHGAEGDRGHESRRPTRRRCAIAARWCADFAERRELIRRGVTAMAERGRAAARVMSDALLDEVTALVEWPVPLSAQFEAALPGAAARSAHLHAAGSSALLPGRGRQRRADAVVHHHQQHREPRSCAGARGQRARRAAAPRRRGVLLGTGSQAAARRAPRSAGQGDLPGEARLDRRQDASACARSLATSRPAWARIAR